MVAAAAAAAAAPAAAPAAPRRVSRANRRAAASVRRMAAADELLPGANAVTVSASAVLEHMLACAFTAKRLATSREFKCLGENGQVGEPPARTTRAELGKSRFRRVGRKTGEQRKAALEKLQERWKDANKKLKDDDAEHWRKLLNVVVIRLLNGPAADARRDVQGSCRVVPAG
jgi:hypothetical protein